jgi:tetratricopeptide (TPR) repeat protein
VRKSIFLLLFLALIFSCSPSEQELLDEGIKLLEASEFEKSIEYFDRAIEKNANNTSALNAKGVALYQLKRYDAAIEAFSLSIKADSTSYKPYFNRGNAYLEKKSFKEAVTDYNRANGLDPSIIDVNYNRGLALLGMESYEDAIFDFDQVIQQDPNRTLAHFNKAKALLGNNDPVAAANSLIATVNLDKQNGPAYYLLGVTQMSAFGQKEEGCANLKMALSLGFSEAKTWIDDFCKD